MSEMHVRDMNQISRVVKLFMDKAGSLMPNKFS